MIWNKDEFYSRFYAVGSSLNSSTSFNEYVDLEDLFINFLFNINNDDRTYRGIIFWLSLYGKYLSPRKIKKKLKLIDYDPAMLGALVTFCDPKFPSMIH